MALIWISDTAKAFRNDNYFYALCKTARGVVVVDATCTHRGGPLIYSTVSGADMDVLTCPWHQRKIYKKELYQRTVPAIHIGHKLLIILTKTKFKILAHGITDL